MSIDDLLHAALTLPTEERAQLAQDLLRSLDGPSDADSDERWIAEIERHVRELDDGSVQPVDLQTARKRIAQRLREGRG